jgi:hypothetical protein
MMIKENKTWEEIPTLQGLEVDWRYQPERSSDKRVWQRIAARELHSILGVKNIPVKIVMDSFQETGALVNVAPGGMAVLLKTKLKEGQRLKVGLYLGKRSVISRAIIRKIRYLEGSFGTGIEFLNLDKESQGFISGMVTSKVFRLA